MSEMPKEVVEEKGFSDRDRLMEVAKEFSKFEDLDFSEVIARYKDYFDKLMTAESTQGEENE